MSACPPDLALERYHRGEIAGTASEVWVEHIRSCAKCAAKLEHLTLEDRAFNDTEFARQLADRLSPRPEAPKAKVVPLRNRWVPAVVAIAAVLLAVVFLRRKNDDDFTPKGGGTLGVLIEREGRVEPWRGEAVGKRDAIQLTWTSKEAGNLAVLGIENDGAVTMLFSGAVKASTDLLLGGRISLDSDARICALFAGDSRPLDENECKNGGPHVAATIDLKVEAP